MIMIHLRFDIEPVGKGRPRFIRQGRPYTPAKTREYEAALIRLMRRAYRMPVMTGPILLVARFWMKAPKTGKKHGLPHVCTPDTDNLIKAVCDAGNEILWADDSQIYGMKVMKHYTPTGKLPGIDLWMIERPSMKGKA